MLAGIIRTVVVAGKREDRTEYRWQMDGWMRACAPKEGGSTPDVSATVPTP